MFTPGTPGWPRSALGFGSGLKVGEPGGKRAVQSRPGSHCVNMQARLGWWCMIGCVGVGREGVPMYAITCALALTGDR